MFRYAVFGENAPEKLSFGLFGVLLSRHALTGLVADRAAGLAGGLAGASALAAACYFALYGTGDRFNLIHGSISSVRFLVI